MTNKAFILFAGECVLAGIAGFMFGSGEAVTGVNALVLALLCGVAAYREIAVPT